MLIQCVYRCSALVQKFSFTGTFGLRANVYFGSAAAAANMTATGQGRTSKGGVSMRVLLAVSGAVLVQPAVLVVSFIPAFRLDALASNGPWVWVLVAAVLAVSLIIVVSLGLPAFYALHRFRRDNWATVSAAGLLLGFVPFAFFWPRSLEGYSAGNNWHGTYVETYKDGLPTEFAWFQYAESLCAFALHGLVGALVFYAIWRLAARSS